MNFTWLPLANVQQNLFTGYGSPLPRPAFVTRFAAPVKPRRGRPAAITNQNSKMKTQSLLTTIATCALAVTITACDKKTPVETTKDAVTDAAAKTADTAKDLTGKAADMAGKATETVKAAASTAVANVTGPFNDAITAAKKSIADKDYKSALAGLNKLSSMKLSDEQTKIVDNLKAEVQKLIAGGSASAVDAAKGLFGK